jgi:hypothetical protein
MLFTGRDDREDGPERVVVRASTAWDAARAVATTVVARVKSFIRVPPSRWNRM